MTVYVYHGPRVEVVRENWESSFPQYDQPHTKVYISKERLTQLKLTLIEYLSSRLPEADRQDILTLLSAFERP